LSRTIIPADEFEDKKNLVPSEGACEHEKSFTNWTKPPPFTN